MKIEGLKSLKRTGTVRLIDSDGGYVDLRVTGLPLGYQADLMREVPGPTPARVKRGMDARGNPLWDSVDYTPEYKQQEMEASSLQSVAIICYALRDEPRVHFSSKRENFSTPADYYRAVRAEMAEMGWSDAEFAKILAAVGSLSALSDENVEAAKDAFLSGGTAGSGRSTG